MYVSDSKYSDPEKLTFFTPGSISASACIITSHSDVFSRQCALFGIQSWIISQWIFNWARCKWLGCPVLNNLWNSCKLIKLSCVRMASQNSPPYFQEEKLGGPFHHNSPEEENPATACIHPLQQHSFFLRKFWLGSAAYLMGNQMLEAVLTFWLQRSIWSYCAVLRQYEEILLSPGSLILDTGSSKRRERRQQVVAAMLCTGQI